ncbi:MAG TPA: S8 family serine peptidase, partial [candidate division Zixibacteria bacterium]|nr:S8 family serine peptidase [candidate division Zixibacteria bacterium]
MSSVSKAGWTCVLLCCLILALPLISSRAADVPALEAQPLVKQKAQEPITAAVSSFLEQRNPDTALVWVYFTDKGVFDKAAFQQKASSVHLSAKVLRRRAKSNVTGVVFADLPVVQNYVQQVSQLGAKLRRTSSWLNAASFKVPMSDLQAIGQLPFVQKVVPVAGFHVPQETVQPLAPDNHTKTHPKDALALDYGYAQAQLEQIHVPEMHAKGYDGSGVTLAMFDTGFRKSHEAFANAYAEGRVLAEYDFIFNDSNTANEPIDDPSQWNHGTLTWSTAGGYYDGYLYGPAYKANFLLAKTEDVRSETPVEEDNWVAALQWADSLGADVISSSLAYSDWYTYSDFDGMTATITIAANTAAGLGIVVCNAMGNEGPSAGTLDAPADAFDILACGAVSSNGTIASFSSRGPTADGRTKPEVCARGVSTACASSSGDNSYTTASGTSLSTPLVAGAVCLLVQAHPNYPPQLIRESMMMTANNASTPDNTYGWGLIDVNAASGYGAQFTADVTEGQAPLTVQFNDISPLSVTGWNWDFGDGNTSTVENPSHEYTTAGAYNVSLTVNSAYGDITNSQEAFILALGDTMTFVPDTVSPGEEAVVSIN